MAPKPRQKSEQLDMFAVPAVPAAAVWPVTGGARGDGASRGDAEGFAGPGAEDAEGRGMSPVRAARRRRDLVDAATFFALARLRCAGCNSADLISVEPGEEKEERSLFLLRASRPDRGWCIVCATRRGWRSTP